MAIFDTSSKPHFFSQRANWTSSSLELDSISFLLKDRIENPDLFRQLTRIQHLVFSRRVDCKIQSLMVIDTTTTTTTTTTTLQLLYLQRADWTSSSLVFDMPTRQHFLFTRREDWKSRLFSASRHEYSSSFFSWGVNWKFSSSFATRYADRVFICPKSGLKIQLYQLFLPFDIVDRFFFPQSGLTSCQ